MKTLKIALCIVLLFSISCFASDFETKLVEIGRDMAGPIARFKASPIIVTDFTDLDGNPTLIGKAIAEELSTALVKASSGYKVIDRTHLRTVLKEHKLSDSGLISPESAKKLGKFLGASALVTGTVMIIGNNAKISSKVIDVETSNIITADSRTILLPEDYKQYFGNLSGPERKEVPKTPKKLILKPTECRGDYELSLSVVGGEVYQNKIKIIILHNNVAGVNQYYCLLNPRYDTYVTDEVGNKYPLIDIDGIASFDTPSQVKGYTKIVKGVPLRYVLTFDAKQRIPKVINFTSTYYTPDMVGVLHFTRTASCSNIQVLEDM